MKILGNVLRVRDHFDKAIKKKNLTEFEIIKVPKFKVEIVKYACLNCVLFFLHLVLCVFYRFFFKMKIRKLAPWIMPLLVLICIAGSQGKRAKKFSPAQMLKESYESTGASSASSLEQLEENIVSWTGVRIPQSKVPATTSPGPKGPKSRRHKTKSGLLIESNIAEDQLTASAEHGSRSTSNTARKQSTTAAQQQRRRNGRLQRPHGKSSSANNGKSPPRHLP